MTTYKGAREATRELVGKILCEASLGKERYNAALNAWEGVGAELISAKFAPLVEAVEKWRTDENLGECGCGTCTALREALEKIL